MKRYVWIMALIGVLIALSFACQDLSSTSTPAATKKCEKVLAEIGDSKICLEEFQARLDKIPPFYRKRVATKKGKMEYLNRLVDDELYYKDALSKGLDKDPEVVDQLEQMRKSLLAGKVKRELMEDKSEIPDEEARKYYEEKSDEEFMSPETVTVKHVLIRLKHKATEEQEAAAKKQAEDVLAKIQSNAITFEKAAEQYSEDKSSAKKGGELPPVRKGLKSKEFEKVAFGFTKEGEISGVFKDRRGYNILKFVSRQEPELKPYDKVELRIKRKIKQTRTKEKMETFSADLKSRFPVKVYEELLVEEEPEEAEVPKELPLIGGEKKEEAKESKEEKKESGK